MTPNDTNFARVMDALDLKELPVAEQEELLLDLNSLIFRGSMVRLIERMDEPTREAFTKLMESNADEAAVESFLRERVPDADEAVRETVQEISNDILAVTGTNTK